MSATIGVAMQNPDSIQDIDGATFAAMARGIKSRFHVPVKTEIEEPTEDEKKQAAEGYNKTSIDTTQLFTYLASFQGRLMRGNLQKIDEDLKVIEQHLSNNGVVVLYEIDIFSEITSLERYAPKTLDYLFKAVQNLKDKYSPKGFYNDKKET